MKKKKQIISFCHFVYKCICKWQFAGAPHEAGMNEKKSEKVCEREREKE